jgi:YesN/AraC family two-component response regulator
MVEKLPLNSLQQLKDYYYIEDTFKKMVETWQAKLPGYEFAAKTLLQQLLLAIVQNIRKQNQNYATSTKVERVIQYIHQNSNHKVTLAELAAMVQLSPTYLSRVFKDITGYSLTEFLNRIKVDKAKELMSEGNMKVKEVAEAVGFNDEFYFSRIFKRIEGISPSEYYSKIVHGL